jgi:hypothetical protein
MTSRDHAISAADLGSVDYWPEPTCSRCDGELPPDSDTGLCATCEAAEDVATDRLVQK